jgi:GT2 family glycosyltransferase
MSFDRDPRVRVVVLNWNSAWYTRRCVESLLRTDYPADRFEVVLVDNGSVDGSAERLADWFPQLRLIRNGANLGFAEGCNRAMRDRDGVDVVALVNNDASVEPGWLRPLVDAMADDPRIGAAGARLQLEPGFVPVDVRAEATVELGAAVVDGSDISAALRFDGVEAVHDAAWPLDVAHRVVRGVGRLWVPAGAGARTLELALSGEGAFEVTCGAASVGGARPHPVSLELPSARTVLVNGIGTARNERAEGFDRWYGTPVADLGDAAHEVVDVPGFCGGAALLRSDMLDEVGLFDPRLFAYYEDTDLSWRATRAGWRIVAVPGAVVDHAFGASGGSRAVGFFHLDRRNWWLTADRNGSAAERAAVREEVGSSLRKALRANVAGRIKRRRPPSFELLAAWARIVADHRAEEARRRRRPRTGPIGASATDDVVGRFQPPMRPRPPSSRPWGPRLVLLDVSGLAAPDATAAVAGPAIRGVLRSLLQDHPELDAVAVRRDADGTAVAGPEVMTRLLDVPAGPAPADPPVRLADPHGLGPVVALRWAPAPVGVPGAGTITVIETRRSGGADARRSVPTVTRTVELAEDGPGTWASVAERVARWLGEPVVTDGV